MNQRPIDKNDFLFLENILLPQNILNNIPEIFEEFENTLINQMQKHTNKYPFTNIWIEETNPKKAVIEILVGGFKKEEVLNGISIDENNNTITIQVNKQEKSENEGNKKYILKNIACRPFKVSYNLPFKNIESINAFVENGKLTIEIFEKKQENKIKLNILNNNESEEK